MLIQTQPTNLLTIMKTQSPWWSESSGFFGDWYLDLVADILTPEQTTQDVNFFISQADLKPKDSVIDIGCADGRHGVELAKKDMHVTCFDLSYDMLKKVEKRAREEHVSVKTIQGDMRALQINESYKLVLNVFTAFGYFENDHDHQKTLEQMYQILKKDGTAILDVVNATFLSRHMKQEQVIVNHDGSKTIYHRKIEDNGKKMKETRELIKDNLVIKQLDMTLRLWGKDELIELVTQCGFTIRHIFGDLNQNVPWSENAKRLVLVLDP